MKSLTLYSILIFAGCLPFLSQSSEQDPAFLMIERAKEVGGEELVDMIEDIPEVAQAYKQCYLKYKEEFKELPNCLWNKIKSQPQVVSKVQKYQGPKSKKENSNDDLESDDKLRAKTSAHFKSKAFAEQDDPGVIALRKYLSQKLNSAIYGEEKREGVVQTIDHSLFYDFYESRVGKNLVLVLTSFCLEAKVEEKKRKIIVSHKEKEREKQRKENVANLSSENGKDNTAYANWQKCINLISPVCYKQTNFISGSSSEDKAYTKERACAVTDYMKTARAAILASQQIKKEMQKLKDSGNSGIAITGIKNVEEKSGADFKANIIDDAISLSSNEIEAAGVHDKREELNEQLDECLNGSSSEFCQKIKEGQQENASRALSEFSLRSDAHLEELKAADSKGVKEYLLSEGRTEEEIKEFSEEKLNKIKEEIEQRYEREKKAIIEIYAKKLKDYESNQKKQQAAASATNFQQKIADIQKQLRASTEGFQQILHFNNIVSGYLPICLGGYDENQECQGQQLTNARSIERELEGLEANQNNRNIATGNQLNPLYQGQELDKLRENIENTGGLQGSGGGQGATDRTSDGGTHSQLQLGVDQINNSFLKYDAENEPPSPTTP